MFSPAPCIFLSILCAGLCVPGQSSYKSIFMVYTEQRVGVSCSVYDMVHTAAKGYIIMCKLVKLAFCPLKNGDLCCYRIDTFCDQILLVFRLSLYLSTLFYCLLDSRFYMSTSA